MNNEDMEELAGMLADIFYDLHDYEHIDPVLSEKMLDFWRKFNHHIQSE